MSRDELAAGWFRLCIPEGIQKAEERIEWQNPVNESRSAPPNSKSLLMGKQMQTNENRLGLAHDLQRGLFFTQQRFTQLSCQFGGENEIR